jgi:aspartyl protease family protein
VAKRGRLTAKPLILWLIACAWTAVGNAQQVELQGVLGSKAILNVDGKRHVLALGQVSPEGVTLKSVELGSAVVEVNGNEQRIELGSRVTRAYTQPDSSTARIYSDSQGMYVAIGSINGFPMKMLLDTGATYVGLDALTARRMGLNYRLRGTPTLVSTANGNVRAYEVTLDSVGVGEININNVKAFVVDGAGLDVPLLGMSFLRRLEVRTNAGTMTLRKHR